MPDHATALSPLDLLHQIYRAMLAAADPLQVVPPHLPALPRGRTVVVGIGKAAAAMAQAVEQHWPGPLTGVVAVPRGAMLGLARIEQVAGSHPVPDESSLAAGQRLLAAVQGLGPDDLAAWRAGSGTLPERPIMIDFDHPAIAAHPAR